MEQDSLEVEEVGRLERKVRGLERAEQQAVARVRHLEEERRGLRGGLEEQEVGARELVARLQEQDSAVTKLQEEVQGLQEKQEVLQEQSEQEKKKLGETHKQELSRLQKEKQELLVSAEQAEDLEAERALLQQKVVEQQVQVSGLQAALQAARHRQGGGLGEERWAEERSVLRTEVEQARAEARGASEEKEVAKEQTRLLQARLLQLEEKVEEQERGSGCDGCEVLRRDVSELEQVQARLQEQVAVARAGLVAAQRTEIPVLAQRLLEEKNMEIAELRSQVRSSS